MENLITARELYHVLIFDYRIKWLGGNINFQLGDISVSIQRKDIIGDVIQKWVEEFLRMIRIDFLANPRVNMPPDIYLNPTNLKKDWLEIKAFNREDNPRFSIANFNFFVEEIIKRPWHLEADYLIFGYVVNENTGNIEIKDLWLKKIWEITKTMADRPLTVQIKNGVVNEIRPCSWYSDKSGAKVFECLEDFLSAFEATLYRNPATRFEARRWKKRFLKSYNKYYGKDIYIPDWESIKQKYRIYVK